MGTEASVLNDLIKEKKRIKKIEESKDFPDLVGDILYRSVSNLDELKFLSQKYDILVFIVEENKVSIRFQKEKANPNQKKKVESETMNAISFEESLFELVAQN